MTSTSTISVLIVEDHEVKEAQLLATVRSTLPDAQVEIARSFQSAVVALESHRYSVVILDMTIPTFDRDAGEAGGRPRTYGGRDLLQELECSTERVPSIVVSQFRSFEDNAENKNLSELEEELRELFPRSFKGAVYFDATRSEWRTKLARRLTSVLKL